MSRSDDDHGPGPTLRPIERCVLRMSAEGMPAEEIGRRLRRSPAHVERVRELAEVPRSTTARSDDPGPLRPLERRVLRWRSDGAGYPAIADRFGRSPRFAELVERMAEYKLTQ